jgi:hypothetical protein
MAGLATGSVPSAPPTYTEIIEEPEKQSSGNMAAKTLD